ncbi:hypothetical protein MJT46_008291 [Ovis ammon polii x Ovis aries]|nr:hypothetical protein MJT46_008291 [Ovis ammon polii x Ovis aries]
MELIPVGPVTCIIPFEGEPKLITRERRYEEELACTTSANWARNMYLHPACGSHVPGFCPGMLNLWTHGYAGLYGDFWALVPGLVLVFYSNLIITGLSRATALRYSAEALKLRVSIHILMEHDKQRMTLAVGLASLSGCVRAEMRSLRVA